MRSHIVTPFVGSLYHKGTHGSIRSFHRKYILRLFWQIELETAAQFAYPVSIDIKAKKPDEIEPFPDHIFLPLLLCRATTKHVRNARHYKVSPCSSA